MYRSINHATFRVPCLEFGKFVPSKKYRQTMIGFSPAMQEFAVAAMDLQQRRYRADYDPLPRFGVSDAKLAIGAGREAVAAFQSAPESERKLFLTLLVCPPR